MTKIRLRAPEDVTAFSWHGVAVPIYEGYVEASEADASVLRLHGFYADDDEEGQRRRAVAIFLSEFRDALLALPSTDMQVVLMRGAGACVGALSEGPIAQTNGIARDDGPHPSDAEASKAAIVAMDRAGLLSFLKQKGIASSSRMRLDDLRALAWRVQKEADDEHSR